MILLLDNRDSFTWNLVQALRGLGQEVRVERSTRVGLADISALRPAGILLGPGPGTPLEAGVTIEVVRELAGEVPILGVCLGMQAIAVAYGAELRRDEAPIHGRASHVEHDGRGLFAGLESPLAVGRYNSLSVDEESLPAEFEVSARAESGTLMGIRHRSLDVEGVQFHPESILSPGGSRLLESFARRARGAVRLRASS